MGRALLPSHQGSHASQSRPTTGPSTRSGTNCKTRSRQSARWAVRLTSCGNPPLTATLSWVTGSVRKDGYKPVSSVYIVTTRGPLKQGLTIVPLHVFPCRPSPTFTLMLNSANCGRGSAFGSSCFSALKPQQLGHGEFQSISNASVSWTANNCSNKICAHEYG